MIFNSVEFVFFLAAALFALATFSQRYRTWLLVVASYIFYSADYPPWLFWLIAVTLFNFGMAKRIEAAEGASRILLSALAIASTLTLLCFYKYSGFIASNVNQFAGRDVLPVINPGLPLGISFFVFESVSYVVDVYRKKMPAVTRLGDYALFISFFPHLVAGPIVRAADFVPQIQTARPFDVNASLRGIELIAVGFFKKLVVSDNLEPFIARVFDAPQQYGGAVYWVAAIAFAVRIYCDFSGYTDIGRGIAKIIGIELTLNFDWPYLSRSIRDFWRRWHISLSNWLRDYLYIPLGGRRNGAPQYVSAILATWFLGGLWHGASWTFVIWGLYHGALVTLATFLPGRKLWDRTPAIVQIACVFALVTIGWVFFRSTTIDGATHMIAGMLNLFSPSFMQKADSIPRLLLVGLMLAAVVHVYTYRARRGKDMSSFTQQLHPVTRAALLGFVAACCILFAGASQSFIYFQF